MFTTIYLQKQLLLLHQVKKQSLTSFFFEKNAGLITARLCNFRLGSLDYELDSSTLGNLYIVTSFRSPSVCVFAYLVDDVFDFPGPFSLSKLWSGFLTLC